MTRLPAAVRVVATVALTALAGWSTWGHWRHSADDAPDAAVDAVPLYLQGVALREGSDPTDAATLAGIKARPESGALRADVVSTLYPPSMAPPMALLVGSGWEVFLARWRGIVLAGFILGSAAAGWGGARGRNAPVAAASGAVIALTLFPLTAHALELGQANLLIVGLLGVATWAAARDRAATAAGAAAIGVAVKLVPGIALWPLLAARRWRALAASVGVGTVVLAITLTSIPAARVVANVLETIRFQQGVTPAWLTLFPGPILPFLGVFRFSPLGFITLVITGLCAHTTRGREQAPGVLAAGMALLLAWLGTAASAVGVFYGLLLLPALIRLAVWPLGERAPRWSWAFSALALLPMLAVTADDGVVLASFQMFLVGLGVWAASATKLLHQAWPTIGRRERLAMLAAVVAAVGFSATMVASAPAFPEGTPGIGGVPAGPPGERMPSSGEGGARGEPQPPAGLPGEGGTPGAPPPIADRPTTPTNEPVPVLHLDPALDPDADRPAGPPQGPPDQGGIPGAPPPKPQ
ncbi:hypothetical protein LBMAG42_01140 [Deltaproteobacteria bacterium]|nr:hypothetical protein LBMAG42_01140 [Deltaproteobacteria bacterium]